MKPKILNKVKSENYIMILYSFKGGKDIVFFNIYTNTITDEIKEILNEVVTSVKSSGLKIIKTGDERINFPDGKDFKYDIRFIIYNKDINKIYDKIKNLFEYGC